MKNYNLKLVMLSITTIALLLLLFMIPMSSAANIWQVWAMYGFLVVCNAYLVLTHKKPNKLVDYTSHDYSEGFNDGVNMTIQAHQELMDAKEDHEVAMAENQAERYPE